MRLLSFTFAFDLNACLSWINCHWLSCESCSCQRNTELQFINIDGEVWKLLILLLIWCMWNVFYPVHNCMLLISLWFSITIHFLSVVDNMNVCFSNAQNLFKIWCEQDKKNYNCHIVSWEKQPHKKCKMFSTTTLFLINSRECITFCRHEQTFLIIQLCFRSHISI